MCGMLDYYQDAFRRLKPAANSRLWSELTYGRSPLQPFLLLSVLDLIAEGKIQRNFVLPSDELGQTFQEYQKLLPERDILSSFVPSFIQLGRHSFWELRARPGLACSSASAITSLKRLRYYYFGARFSSDLYPLLQMHVSREKLHSTVMETYFAPQLRENIRMIKINQF